MEKLQSIDRGLGLSLVIQFVYVSHRCPVQTREWLIVREKFIQKPIHSPCTTHPSNSPPKPPLKLLICIRSHLVLFAESYSPNSLLPWAFCPVRYCVCQDETSLPRYLSMAGFPQRLCLLSVTLESSTTLTK